MATTADVVQTLLAAGWRWETLGDGQVLTNAPAGQTLCVACGAWVATTDIRDGAYCLPCYNAQHVMYNHTRQSTSAMTT